VSAKGSNYNPLMWLASLRLTVVLLAMGMYLIFVGTLAQVELGIWEVVSTYFRSWYVKVPFDVFRALLYPGSDTHWKGKHPFPGGFLILAALMVNLLAAHAMRFKIVGKGKALSGGLALIFVGAAITGYTVYDEKISAMLQADVMLMLGVWALPMLLIAVGCHLVFGSRKSGIVMLHAGLILMLLGEFITGLAAKEGQLWVPEFGSANTVIDIREAELAFVTDAKQGAEQHVAVPQWMLEQSDEDDKPIADAALPLSVRVDAWMVNSQIIPQSFSKDMTQIDWKSQALPAVTGTQQQSNRPSAVVTLFKGDDRLGQYLLSTWEFVKPIEVEAAGKTWRVELRFKQTPLDYTLQLNDFRHDTFTGSRTARNFSSDMRLVGTAQTGTREVYIKMNQPLRYDGKAFFQSGFFQQPLNKNLGTILQVADNPGAWVPYLSCVVVTVGLTVHFFASLLQFARRSRSRA